MKRPMFTDTEFEKMYEKAARHRDDKEDDVFLDGVVSALGWVLGREDNPLRGRADNPLYDYEKMKEK
jgi:hypothetical protein